MNKECLINKIFNSSKRPCLWMFANKNKININIYIFQCRSKNIVFMYNTFKLHFKVIH